LPGKLWGLTPGKLLESLLAKLLELKAPNSSAELKQSKLTGLNSLTSKTSHIAVEPRATGAI
jgi:hypothetical protein